MSNINLSQSQLGIFYAHLYENEGKFFNIFSEIKFQNEISVSVFRRMILELSQKHTILRSVLKDDSAMPYRFILDDFKPLYEFIDFSDLNDKETERSYNKLVEEWKSYQFPLTDHLLFKSVLVQISKEEYIWLASFHQIINDGYGVSYICEEAGKIYQSILDDEPTEVNVNDNFENYILYENDYLNSSKYIKSKHFWENKLSDIEILDTTIGFPNHNTSLDSQRFTVKLDKDKSNEINRFLIDNNITGNSFFLSVLYIYLSKLFVRNEIIIGTTVLNRPKSSFKESAGMFVNFIPNIFSFDQNESTLELFKCVEKEVKENFRHQRFPMSEIYRELSLKREDVYPVLFNFQKSIFIKKFGNLNVTHDWLFNGFEEHFFSLNVVDRDDLSCFELNFDINQSAFSGDDSQLLINRYIFLVDEFLKKPQKKIIEYSIIPDNEYRSIRSILTGKESQFEHFELGDIVEKSAELFPNKTAIKDHKSHISYYELNNKINTISQFLNAKGIKKGQTVCIVSDPSIDSIATMIALFKCGIVYVPVDAITPIERIQFIKKDCNAALVISQKKLNNITTILFEELYSSEITNVESNVPSPNNVAYIIYTSGSTGTPKGVLVQFKQIQHYVSQFIDYFKLTENDVVAQQASLSFDTSFEEILPALKSGSTLHLLKRSKLTDIDYVVHELNSGEVSLLSASPTLISELNNIEFTSTYLRVLISGGDELHQHHISKLNKNISIYNTYGPTEATICATYSKVNRKSKISLGEPVANTKIYLLNDIEEDVPFSSIGEICIEGSGVSKGYLNQHELTNEKFVRLKNMRLVYKTGDLAKLLPDGTLKYLGRKDFQVNLNGYRIELGEVDAHLNQNKNVERAVTLCIQPHSEPILVSFICSKTEDLSELKSYLSGKLPSYMIPNVFQFVNEIPVDKNGKINRKELAKLYVSQGEKKHEEITDNNELLFANIWQNLLEINIESRNAHFFELGGNSLKVSQLIKKVEEHFQISLEFKDVFLSPTLHELAEKIFNKDRSVSIDLKPLSKTSDYYNVSNAQKRLWLLNQYENVGAAYNIPIIYELSGKLNLEFFNKAFNQVIKRHESFRTNFTLIEGELKQFINPHKDIILNQYNGHENDLDLVIGHYVNYRFNLENEPLYQIGLFEQDNTKFTLMFTVHHLITDGWSISVFVKELFQLYNSFKNNVDIELPNLSIQYKDYAVWQNERLKAGSLEISKKFWLEEFNNLSVEQSFPLDFARSKTKSYSGSSKSVVISKSILKKIKSYNASNDTTLYMYLLAIVNLVLYKYSRNKSIVVGAPVANRVHSDLDDQIGFYANTVAIKNEITKHQTFEGMIRGVKDKLLSIYQYQDYPFDILIEDLGFDNTQNKNPLFDVMVILQNANEKLPELDGIKLKKTDVKRTLTLFDLTFKFEEIDDFLEFELEFNTDLLLPKTASKIVHDINQFILKTLSNNEVSINELIQISVNDQAVINESNQTDSHINRSLSIVDLFETQVANTPRNVAVIFGGNEMTYEELNTEVNKLAHFLIELSVESGDCIALEMSRSDLLFVSVLAVLKVGASFVPVGINLPLERKKYIKENAKYVLTEFKDNNSNLDKHIAISKLNLDRFSE